MIQHSANIQRNIARLEQTVKQAQAQIAENQKALQKALDEETTLVNKLALLPEPFPIGALTYHGLTEMQAGELACLGLNSKHNPFRGYRVDGRVANALRRMGLISGCLLGHNLYDLTDDGLALLLEVLR